MNENRNPLGAQTELELRSQPEMWSRAATLADDVMGLFPRSGEKVLIVGCGTSYYIGEAYAYLRNDAGLGRTRAAIPRELPWIDPDEHIIALSRSGTTADVVEFVDRYRGTHQVTVVLGDPHTPAAALTDRTVSLDFADEKSVVQTRFATTALTALRASIQQLPETLASDARKALDAPLPMDPHAVTQVVFLGHRWTAGIAEEAALKLRESAGAWSESYSMWEYLHGPVSCATPDSLIWALDELPESVRSTIEKTGATIYTNNVDPQASLVLAHRFALELARTKGRNPDIPPFLNRAVTDVR